jgi:hypothetical protein
MSSSVACHLTHRPETLNAGLARRNAHSSHELARCASGGGRSLRGRRALVVVDAVRDRCIAIRVRPTFDSKVRSSQDLSVKRTFEEIDEGARLGGRRAASRKHRP